MLIKRASAVAALALAAHATASENREPLMKMSTRQLFGLARRDGDADAYQPAESVCGAGDTCAQACGAGFAPCKSKDDSVHCFNPDQKQVCCPGASGNSCDDGFYCAADKSAKIWCCPQGSDLAACAAKFNVAGGLFAAAAETTTTAASSSSTSAAPTTYSTSSSSSRNSTTTAPSSTTSVPSAGITAPSSGLPRPTTNAAGPTSSLINGATGPTGSAGALLVFVAAGVAALL